MFGYGLIARRRVDDVGISLKVSKVRTMDDKRRDATIMSSCGHVEMRDGKSCDLFAQT